MKRFVLVIEGRPTRIEIGKVAVAVQIDAQRARDTLLEDVVQLSDPDALAAAVGKNVLVGRVDRQDQAVGQREARLAADVAGVRRVDLHAKLVGDARALKTRIRDSSLRQRLIGRVAARRVRLTRHARDDRARAVPANALIGDAVDLAPLLGGEVELQRTSDQSRCRGNALRPEDRAEVGQVGVVIVVVAVLVVVARDRDEVAASCPTADKPCR